MAQAFSIVVGYDSTEVGGYAFARAALLARSVPGSEIHLVFVMPESTAAAAVKTAAAGLKGYAKERAASLGGLVGQKVGVHIRLGDAAKEIVQFSNELGASLIIVGGKRQPTLKQVILGSVSEHIVDNAEAPVMIAVSPPHERATTTVTIEGPCPDCVAERQKTHGAVWWCARHREKHPHAHVYSFQEELPWGMHDSEVTMIGTE